MSLIIVDYGLGNLGSIKNIIKYLGYQSEITSEIIKIESATKLILPGVGAFDYGMKNIIERGLKQILDQKALEEKIPIFGICLGMQLMTNKSEEGNEKGLGWIDAETLKFRFPEQNLRIPHMGWNIFNIVNNNILLKDMYEDPRFYFIHSFYVKCYNSEDIVSKTQYGIEFDSMISKENIFGCQFHPEKSHKFGMKILKNFAEL